MLDADASRARRAAEEYEATAYTELDSLLANDEVEAVIVATPHTSHYPVVSAVLEAGRHALVEKPLATTASDAWALVGLARERGLMLAVGATYQYARTYAQIERAVREDIGELVCVNGEFASQTQSLFATTDPALASLDDPTSPHGTTYSDPALSGGGQGQTQLSHVLGSILKTTGMQASDVFAYMSNRGLTADLVDALAFRLESGVLCTTTSTGTVPVGVPLRHTIRYHGSAGMIEHDILAATADVYLPGGIVRRIAPEPEVGAPQESTYEIDAPARLFVDRISGIGDNRAPGGAGAAAVALIDAAYESARTGARVDVIRGDADEVAWR